MRCNEVQKRLSAYCDSAVSAEDKARIDEHLTRCEQCGEALSDLQKTIGYLQGLDEVEPPLWLTQKVMAQVRSEAEHKKSLLQRLFYPLQIKLPLEAIAILLVAVGSIYVFKGVQPEIRLAKAPPIKTEEAAPRVSAPEKEETFARHTGAPASAKPADQFAYTDKQETRERGVKSVETTRAAEEIAKNEEVVPSAGIASQDELKGNTVTSQVKTKSLIAKKRVEKKEKDIRVRIDVKDIKAGVQEVEKVLALLGGHVTETESFDDRAIIYATLSAEKAKELEGRLNLIGEVKKDERLLLLEDAEGEVRARIEIEETPNNP